MSNTNYNKLVTYMQKLADLKYAGAILNWDQEVYLPAKAAAIRGRQLATLSGMAHEMFVSDELGNILKEVLENTTALNDVEKSNVHHINNDYLKEKKYSTEFVIQLTETISQCYHDWASAKAKSDFSIYKNSLQKLLELKREETKILGYQSHPYNALLDLYEPELTVADVSTLFDTIKSPLQNLINSIAAKPKPNNAFMHQYFDKDAQWQWGLSLLKDMQYDFEAGRQDISIHPFTTSFGSTDVRVTTHVDENNFYPMTWSCLHEGGHGLYEQGLSAEQYGLPCGEAISLGIHESQSRLWENMVGRSLPYWQYQFPKMQQSFATQFANINVQDFYKAINLVTPSLIRIEADELTYHFHILIRFEIEKALIEGSIQAADIPSAWNELYKKYLNVTVPNDAQGCLQDIHWSHGSFGYFPTYSIGSFYAAQFFMKAAEKMPNLISEVEQGNTSNLLSWLRENIHQYGRQYSAKDLCIKVCNEPLNSNYFIQYAQKKYGALYNL